MSHSAVLLLGLVACDGLVATLPPAPLDARRAGCLQLAGNKRRKARGREAALRLAGLGDRPLADDQGDLEPRRPWRPWRGAGAQKRGGRQTTLASQVDELSRALSTAASVARLLASTNATLAEAALRAAAPLCDATGADPALGSGALGGDALGQGGRRRRWRLRGAGAEKRRAEGARSQAGPKGPPVKLRGPLS